MKSKAIIVQRVGPHKKPDTSEIESLARSAGYSIVSTLTQSREEDKEYNIGSGKVHESSRIASNDEEVRTIIVDNELGPYQMYNYGIYVPSDVEVLDRYKLILGIFEKRADNRKTKLQVEKARLRYELPRSETKVRLSKRNEKPGFMGLGEYDESRENSIKDRLKSINEKLNTTSVQNSMRRENRKENGNRLVSLAGYTNAGKSTLLRRLSEDLDINQNEGLHNDIKPTAESSSDLFTTLDTLTRRMDFERRDILLTDTIGFIDRLPDWLINAFKQTLDSIYKSDLILLVVDITDDLEIIKRKIATGHDIISRFENTSIITVFNKSDKATNSKINTVRQNLDALAPHPVYISAKTGDNVDELKQEIHNSLPPLDTNRLLIPHTEDSMSLVSWIYDNAYVTKCNYMSSNIMVEFEAQRRTIKKANSMASSVLTQES